MANKSRATKHEDLEHLSHEQLLQRAEVKGIKDRNNMSREELLAALQGE